MRMRFARLTVLATLIVPLGVMGVFAAPASAEEGPTCTGGSGKMKISPGLTETAQIQTITIKGKLTGCENKHKPFRKTSTTANYTVTEKTTEPVSCATFAGESPAGGSPTGTVSIKWKEKGVGESTGTISIPLSGLAEVEISGQVESGAFAGSKISGAVVETLNGTCEGKKKKKQATANATRSNSY